MARKITREIPRGTAITKTVVEAILKEILERNKRLRLLVEGRVEPDKIVLVFEKAQAGSD